LIVKLLTHTPEPEKMVASAARLCYSDSNIETIRENLNDDEIRKFIEMLLEINHLSVFEHASFTFGIEGASRAAINQLVRHRTGKFCISKDAKIYTNNKTTNKKTIEELYNLTNQYKKNIKIKCIDEQTKTLQFNNFVDIYKSGIKDVYKITTINNYITKTTMQHQFFTQNGWRKLSELKIGDKIYINGMKSSKDFVKKKYDREKAILTEIVSIEYIGKEETYDIEMVSPHHNFIADGFVVHNSQQSLRYVKYNSEDIIIPETIMKNEKAKEIYINHIKASKIAYEQLTELLLEDYMKNSSNKDIKKYEKLAIEDARNVLPLVTETKIIMTMDARNLLHFFNERCCNRAQKEIRDIAFQMCQLVKQVAPNLFKHAGPKCLKGSKCPEGKMTCGKIKEVINAYNTTI